jgi:hypothetical protein
VIFLTTAPPGLLAIRVAVALVGVVVIARTFMSAIKTVVVPRSKSVLITRSVFVSVRKTINLIARESKSFEHRDRWYSIHAPLAFLLLPVVWLLLSGIGFGLIYWALDSRGGLLALREAFLASGSSMLTLGVFFRRDLPSASIEFAQATLGLILVAMLISYLPTIYAAYSRRETLVAMLESRAGLPPSPSVALTRFHWIGALDQLDEDIFTRWEPWFAEVEESHLSFPGLALFRSPHIERSWITAAGTVLDLAALRIAVIDLPGTARASLCLRQGFFALRRIANYFKIANPQNPQPGDPISITREEFDVVLVELREVGLPVKADDDQAWLDFSGWRVNYDAALVGLCKMVHAPPAKWSSDRV